MTKLVVIAASGYEVQADALASELGLARSAVLADDGFALSVTPQRLELVQAGPQAPGPVYVDFISGKAGHRFRFGGGRGQLVAKAIGIKKDFLPSVIDATAGLGRDAFVLASLGCKVRMMERSPIVAALLADGMTRALADPEIGKVVTDYMQLEVASATEKLVSLAEDERPDVVYVDPMHPGRSKSSLVKKEMRVFRQLVGADDDAPALLDAALQVAKKRIVVKRPRKAEAIAGPQPDLVMSGKSTRFDIYFRN